MDVLHAILLGIIEGATEFLPISSTGHLILASHLLEIPESAFHKSFMIAIQLGAILAVFSLYAKHFFDFAMLKKLLVAFVPTAIIGLAAYSFVKTFLLGNELIVVTALFLGGIVLIAFEYLHTEGEQDSVESITYKQAALIGLFQSIAIIPGVSRSAATIVGGMLLGMKRSLIVEFSFLLAVPTMAAATGLDILKNYETILDGNLGILAIGFIVAFIVALFAVKFLLAFVKRYTFIPFGIYRIALALVFFAFLL